MVDRRRKWHRQDAFNPRVTDAGIGGRCAGRARPGQWGEQCRLWSLARFVATTRFAGPTYRPRSRRSPRARARPRQSTRTAHSCRADPRSQGDTNPVAGHRGRAGAPCGGSATASTFIGRSTLDRRQQPGDAAMGKPSAAAITGIDCRHLSAWGAPSLTRPTAGDADPPSAAPYARERCASERSHFGCRWAAPAAGRFLTTGDRRQYFFPGRNHSPPGRGSRSA